MIFNAFPRFSPRPLVLVAALAACGSLSGCGSSAPEGEVVGIPSNVLEDARNSDAAYDQAAAEAKHGKKRASSAAKDRQIPSF